MADNKTDDGEWGGGGEREKHQKDDERKQIGTPDQFRIPCKTRGQPVVNSERNVM
jgi:hypothetical protein